MFIENLISKLSVLFPGLILTSLFTFIPAAIISLGLFLSNKQKSNKRIAFTIKLISIILALLPPVYLIIDGFFAEEGAFYLFLFPFTMITTILLTSILITPILIPILFAVVIKKQKAKNQSCYSLIICFILLESLSLILNYCWIM